MPTSLSPGLRSRIASAVTAGERVRAVAARFAVSAATAGRLGQKARTGGDLLARPRGVPPEPIIKDDATERVKSRLAEKPDLMVRGLAAELCARGSTVTDDTL